MVAFVCVVAYTLMKAALLDAETIGRLRIVVYIRVCVCVMAYGYVLNSNLHCCHRLISSKCWARVVVL